ncbi:MAG TPA: RidA family protein, partial [Micromonosporaceae bacterium]
MTIARFGSGGPWEERFGYSRTVVAGAWVLSAGCTSTVDGAVAHVGDPAAQTREAFQLALRGLAQAGAGVEHVVRTRMYVVHPEHAEAIGRVHGELFGRVKPVATMVMVAALIDPDHLVEVEV